MGQAFHDSPARLEPPFGSAEGRADPRLAGYGPGTRCGDRRSFQARSRARGQAWGAAEDAGQFLRATIARAEGQSAARRGAVSQGALAGLFQRVKPSFDAQVSAILARLRQSRIVCSDETGARVKGCNAWEWVFQNEEVCVHVIRNSRAKAVAQEVMAGHRPAIWVSDLYAGGRPDGRLRWGRAMRSMTLLLHSRAT